MSRKKYLYGIDGVISQIFPTDIAEIEFDLDGTRDYALLKKSRFYHDGRLVPENVQLSKYIRNNMKVKFSCHVLDQARASGQDDQDIYHHRSYNWFAIVCWVSNDDSPNNKVTVSMGLSSVSCSVESVRNRHGVLTTIDSANNENRIEFLASKFYHHAKRFSSSKMLSSVLNKDDKMFCDAVPCIEEESRDNCKWFATCAFLGKRPRLAQPLDMSNDFRANYLVQTSQKLMDQSTNNLDNDENHDDDPLGQYSQQSQMKINLKSQLLKVINLIKVKKLYKTRSAKNTFSVLSGARQALVFTFPSVEARWITRGLRSHTSNPRTLFTSGYGFILDVLNDEFAILLGCFKLNIFQTILFHRRNAFLFKSSLVRSKLSEIFVEGDRMRFIAVGAPSNFVTDWIAVQVSVAEFTPEIEDSRNS